jgi:hypothetical protein
VAKGFSREFVNEMLRNAKKDGISLTKRNVENYITAVKYVQNFDKEVRRLESGGELTKQGAIEAAHTAELETLIGNGMTEKKAEETLLKARQEAKNVVSYCVFADPRLRDLAKQKTKRYGAKKTRLKRR